MTTHGSTVSAAKLKPLLKRAARIEAELQSLKCEIAKLIEEASPEAGQDADVAPPGAVSVERVAARPLRLDLGR